ncbi:MAG TPA: branched-chain amino acid ABC transporter permease, partial [Xanthobacteraceae bacterium]|nr:branched-chain amino acid ABC transporter permease [Xanthobacteraceae bacterium]
MSTHAMSPLRRIGGLPLMPERGTASVFELALLLICAALVVVRLPQNIQDVIILTYLWAGLALAWNIAGGYAGLISFGHAAFFGIGAYTSTILGVKAEITPWIGIWLGGLLSAACGTLLALICARLRGPFFILSTLAAAEVVRIGALNWATLTGGPEGLAILPVPSVGNMVFASKHAYAVLMLGYLVVVYVAAKFIEGSRYGYRLFAVRDDEDAASAAGINPLLMRASAMGISAFITGIG